MDDDGHVEVPEDVADLAFEHGLGTPIREYRYSGNLRMSARDVNTAINPWVAALGPVVLVLAALTHGWVSWAGLALGLPLSIIFARQVWEHRRRLRLRRLYQYSGGLVIVMGDLHPEVVAWDEVDDYDHTVDHIDGHEARLLGTPAERTYHSHYILTTARVPVEIHSEFHDTGPLAEAIEAAVLPGIIRSYRDRFEAGEELEFGDLRIGPTGIGTGPTGTVPWSEVDRIEVEDGLAVYRIGVDTPVIEVDADHLDHLPAVEAILTEASSQEDASR
ncbi:DUF6585 family protein [Virgisporangium aurantiacum]|uniref:DUF6585 family protein n=1 Tax=Virgisporangium aurantiacum TaxID=175570 RepID=UPI00194E50CF|nr:DUF6585 family protein [Virgisporangium aurantiacum]